MPALRKYPQELRGREQRLVAEVMLEDPVLSLTPAVKRIGERAGVNPDTLRTWVRQAGIDAGERSGTTSEDSSKVRKLESEVRELKRTNEILLAASSFFARELDPATAVVVAFISEYRQKFGVEAICRVLTEHGCQIAPGTYYAAVKRGRSARALREEQVLIQIRRVPSAARGGLSGARKVYQQLRRENVLVTGTPVARCTVARCTVEGLMAAAGLCGVSRRRTVRTTVTDPAADRAPDLVKRDFTATAPNQWWVVDFTYVATAAGWVYVAFAIDVFSRMIVGWRSATSMKTDLPLDALEMAIWFRERLGRNVSGLFHHSDAGCQLRFKRS